MQNDGRWQHVAQSDDRGCKLASWLRRCCRDNGTGRTREAPVNRRASFIIIIISSSSSSIRGIAISIANSKSKFTKQVRPSSGTDVYPHMPILGPHAARLCVREPKGNRCERRGGGSGAPADSSDFGLMGKQSSPKWEIPCLGRRRTAVQNLTPLALSSAEKFVTVHTHTTHKH